jgi:hypothetical protein
MFLRRSLKLAGSIMGQRVADSGLLDRCISVPDCAVMMDEVCAACVSLWGHCAGPSCIEYAAPTSFLLVGREEFAKCQTCTPVNGQCRSIGLEVLLAA